MECGSGQYNILAPPPLSQCVRCMQSHLTAISIKQRLFQQLFTALAVQRTSQSHLEAEEIFPYRNDKVVSTLAQGCHNIGTRLPQCFFTTLSQPCILKLSQGCDKVVRTLSQGCPNIVTRLPQCNLVTTLAQPCILKLSQGCDKVVARLSQGCTNIVTRLPQCTLSQPCILKLWQL